MEKRIASVNQKVCVACGACMNVCPRQAIAVWKGCHAKVDMNGCIGCGICMKTCPANCISIESRGIINA